MRKSEIHHSPGEMGARKKRLRRDSPSATVMGRDMAPFMRHPYIFLQFALNLLDGGTVVLMLR